MTTITVRNISDAAATELSTRAAATGRSLQEYLRLRLEAMVEVPDAEVWAAQVKARLGITGGSLSSETIVDLLREDRDR